MSRLTLRDILDGEDRFGLLKVKVRPASRLSPQEERDAEIVSRVSDFFETQGRKPDPQSTDPDEMQLGTIWEKLRVAPSQAMIDADRHGLLQPPVPEGRSWRDALPDQAVPRSLAEIDLSKVSPALTRMSHVTPAIRRAVPDHRAEAQPCFDFLTFEPLFDRIQKELDDGSRTASIVKPKEPIVPREGDFFISRGLIVHVAEKTETTLRNRRKDHRLRLIYSNGTENDPLVSSFRKTLWEDPTSRIIQRLGTGPFDPAWQADRLPLTGRIYVLRSLSDRPNILPWRNRMVKIGVTTQDVRRRIADARNDPTFLLAPVKLIATYELHGYDWRRVEALLHRYFEAARPDIWIMDRFGKKVRPKEWFAVEPEDIREAVEKISKGTLRGTFEPRRS